MNNSSVSDFLKKIQGIKNQHSTTSHTQHSLLEDRKNVLDLNIIIAVDVSGSINRSQYQQFMQYINNIKGLSRVKVIETDTKVVAMYDYFKIKSHQVARLKGGGGTDFKEAFHVIERMNPDAVLFLTDGNTENNVSSCAFPVGWVLTHRGKAPYDFGEIVMELPALNNN